MKKIFLALATIGLIVSTPATARDRSQEHSQRWENNRGHHNNSRNYRDRDRHDYRRDRGSAVVVGIIAGAILGGVLSNQRSYQYQYDRRVHSERVCYEYRVLDQYGRVVSRFDCR